MGKEKKKMMHILSENIKPEAFQNKSHLDVLEKFTLLHYMIPPINHLIILYSQCTTYGTVNLLSFQSKLQFQRLTFPPNT